MSWKLWEVPVGPKSSTDKRLILEGSKDEVLLRYEEDRQIGGDEDALVVTDDNGNTVYACS